MNAVQPARSFLHPHSLLILITLLLTGSFAFSQDEYDGPPSQNLIPPVTPPPASHAIYAELGGPGMLLSLNYDSRLSSRKDGLGIRAGIGTSFGKDPSFVSVPVGLNYLVGHGGNYFEGGAGITYVDIDNATPNQRFSIGNKDYDHTARLVFGNIVLGYRHQVSDAGVNVRAGISPFFGGGTAGMLPYFSLGYNF